VKGFSGDGGPATAAEINNPFGLTRGPDGSLYFCDTDNQRVRRIDQVGLITTVAGSGIRGYAGDGGNALAAHLNEPYEVRFDARGDLFIVERLNHVVRRIETRTGRITTVAGTGKPGFSGDDGPAIAAQLHEPHSIAIDPEGNLYVADIRNHRIRMVEARTGIIRTFAGTGERKTGKDGSRYEAAPLNGPRALDFDRSGGLWVALREGNAVYRLDRALGTMHHEAGTGKAGFTGNGGPAKAATLSGPKGIAVGPDGNIYLADCESHSIRLLDRKRGTVELIAGTGERGDGPDGADPKKCKLARPHGVFVDADGTVFVGDSEAHRIRAIRPLSN
jgi:DNA-binding beta-propeller fold protein YncE